jgi:ribonuclease P protein component
MGFKLPNKEKLKSRKMIATLFSEGKSVAKYPVRMIYLQQEVLENSRAAFSVPKRNFKRAVDRNHFKRLMREAYRLHKNTLNPNNEGHFALLFLYIGQDDEDFGAIEKAMIALLKKLPGSSL